MCTQEENIATKEGIREKNSSKVQTQSVTTACFAKEEPLGQITNTHMNKALHIGTNGLDKTSSIKQMNTYGNPNHGSPNKIIQT